RTWWPGWLAYPRPGATCRARRAFADGTPTTIDSGRCSGGNRGFRSKRAWPAPTNGSRRRWLRHSQRKGSAMRLHDPFEGVVPRVDVLGVQVSAINLGLALDVLDHCITTGSSNSVCF